MQDLIIPSTRCTPEINFRYSENLLEISGESYPEDTNHFYKPVFAWIRSYLGLLKNEIVTVNIWLVYFNSSSSKILINLFDELETAVKKGKTITVNWIYKEGDDDNLDFGAEFSEDLKFLKFNMVQGK